MEVGYLELSKAKEKELFEFMKGTKNKEEYGRASTGVPIYEKLKCVILMLGS